MPRGRLHHLTHKHAWFDKPGQGSVTICAWRFTGRLAQVLFIPESTPWWGYPVAADEMIRMAECDSESEAMQVLGDREPLTIGA